MRDLAPYLFDFGPGSRDLTPEEEAEVKRLKRAKSRHYNRLVHPLRSRRQSAPEWGIDIGRNQRADIVVTLVAYDLKVLRHITPLVLELFPRNETRVHPRIHP